MGALLSKPIASSFRVWDLTSFKTIDYLNTLSETSINVYLFANKPVRILPVDTWISDRLRFSFDGWYRQRLSSCYHNGIKISWFKALALFSSLTLQKRVAFHWSSVESGLVRPFLTLLAMTGSLVLPYTNLNSSVIRVRENLISKTSYRWSLHDNYPTYLNSSGVKTFLYRSNLNLTLQTGLQSVLTSAEETEEYPLGGTFSSQVSDISCLVQTEALTSQNFIYFGTHGYINAQRAKLAIPILMAYERTNDLTGNYFVKGPLFSRSLVQISFVLSQLYSKYFYGKPDSFKLLKPYFYNSGTILLKSSNFNFKKSLSYFRQPPQYEVSPLVQILNEFVKHE